MEQHGQHSWRIYADALDEEALKPASPSTAVRGIMRTLVRPPTRTWGRCAFAPRSAISEPIPKSQAMSPSMRSAGSELSDAFISALYEPVGGNCFILGRYTGRVLPI